MSAEPFLDTNILVYAYSTGDRREQPAEALVLQGGIVSVQVLTEFVNVSINKQKRSWQETEAALLTLRQFLKPPQPLTAEIHDRAVQIAQRYGLHIYDAMIVAAALEAGCATLYTEDMQDGLQIGALTVRNPFVP